jgi:hypothetical protein
MKEICFLNFSLEAAPIPPSRMAGNFVSEDVLIGELPGNEVSLLVGLNPTSLFIDVLLAKDINRL